MVDINKILDTLGLIFGIAGAILVGQLYAIGFLSFIVGSLNHGILGYRNENYGLTLTCLLFILIDIYYYIQWSIT